MRANINPLLISNLCNVSIIIQSQRFLICSTAHLKIISTYLSPPAQCSSRYHITIHRNLEEYKEIISTDLIIIKFANTKNCFKNDNVVYKMSDQSNNEMSMSMQGSSDMNMGNKMMDMNGGKDLKLTNLPY